MNKKALSPAGGPVVCAAGENYIICVPVRKNVLMSAEVGGKTYYCESNGVRVSNTRVQKIPVPCDVLNSAGKYKITYEVINKRLPYSCDKQEPVSREYCFRPVEKESGINIYHLSDVHGFEKAAVRAGGFFGDKLDLLILNGDIASSSDSANDILLTYRIAYEITKGEIPCVISRGNHDLRGKYAEKLGEFLPTDSGRTYFTARIGALWILVLDCGEDKPDDHREYTGTVAFHPFRERESKFIEQIINNKADEYEADGVKYRMVLCHVPFCYDNTEECKGERPFDIEKELYTDWCSKIRENIKPDFSLFGHLHVTEVCPSGSELDNKNLGGNIILGGKPAGRSGTSGNVIGTALTVDNSGTRVRFTDSKGSISADKFIEKKI